MKFSVIFMISWLALVGSLAFAQDELSEPEYSVIFEKDVPIQVRDGTVLRADIYRPDVPQGNTEKFPALISLSAYQKAMDPVPITLRPTWSWSGQRTQTLHASPSKLRSEDVSHAVAT